MTAPAETTTPIATVTVWAPCGFPRQVRVLTGRYLRTSFGDPRLLVLGLAQPVVLFLLFSQVFAGVAAVPGFARYHGYLDFLLPATLVNIALTTAMGSGYGLLSDTYTGFIGRLRTMPVSPVSLLVARTLADAIRLAVQLAVIILVAVTVLGFRPGSYGGLLAAVVLTVGVGWAMCWVFLAIAVWRPRLESMQAVTFVVMFPLMFTSSAYMPIDTMPAWLRVVARGNPVTYSVDATRALALGAPSAVATVAAIALAACAGLAGFRAAVWRESRAL